MGLFELRSAFVKVRFFHDDFGFRFLFLFFVAADAALGGSDREESREKSEYVIVGSANCKDWAAFSMRSKLAVSPRIAKM